MDDRQRRQEDRFKRVKNFATVNATDAAATAAATHLTKLSDIIEDMDKARTGQAGASAIPHQTLLLGLLRDCRDIARTARAIGQEDIGFATLFPRPKAQNPAAVLLSLDTIIANLTLHPTDDAPTQTAKTARLAKLTAHGLAPTLPADLAASRLQYMDARDDEDTGDTEGVEDTAALKRLVNEGRRACAHLDSIFHNLYRRNPDKLAGWTSANNLEDDPKPGDKDKDEEEPPTPPTPPTPPNP